MIGELDPYKGSLGPWPEFTVSASTVKMLDRGCLRAVWFKRWAGWGGWEAPSGHWRRRVYVESKVRSLAAFVGLEVHASASRALRNAVNGYDTDWDRELERALDALDLIVVNTHRGAWRESPKKHPPLAELYYNHPDQEDRLEAARERLLVLIPAIRGQVEGIVDQLHAGTARVLSNEQRFRREVDVPGVGRVVVWISADAVLNLAGDPHDRLRVIDWKTSDLESYGDEKVASIIKADMGQVGLYSLWAGAHYSCPPESMDMALHYIGQERDDGAPWVETVQPTVESKLEAWNKLQADAKRLAELVVDGDVATNKPLPLEHFPKAERGSFLCRTCDYRGICGRD